MEAAQELWCVLFILILTPLTSLPPRPPVVSGFLAWLAPHEESNGGESSSLSSSAADAERVLVRLAPF